MLAGRCWPKDAALQVQCLHLAGGSWNKEKPASIQDRDYQDPSEMAALMPKSCKNWDFISQPASQNKLDTESPYSLWFIAALGSHRLGRKPLDHWDYGGKWPINISKRPREQLLVLQGLENEILHTDRSPEITVLTKVLLWFCWLIPPSSHVINTKQNGPITPVWREHKCYK